jgi:hypothetical protein
MEVGSISSVLGRVALQPGGTSLFLFGNGNQMTNTNMSGGIIRGTITYITNWLLKRDLDPGANDGDPAWLNKAA